MCGICGIQSPEPEPLGDLICRMNGAQVHRGPDGEGYCVSADRMALHPAHAPPLDAPAICALGHRRLAIIDPAGGAQPMLSADGRQAVLLNGEIYNFEELRSDLEAAGAQFTTRSDTEVLLHLYRRHPDEPTRWLRQLNGIFAIALWDQDRRQLLLARDPFGVKPLHYADSDGRFLFASEIKSLLAAGHRPRLNRAALHLFMNIRYAPGEDTLFAGVHRLPPAHYAVVKGGKLRHATPYYDLRDAIQQGGLPPASDLPQLVRGTFYEAVRRQLVSDVPLGVPLSGGLDSSMIVAAAHSAYRDDRALRSADRSLRTFTLGFNEPTDENEDAAVVARAFDTEHDDTKLPLDTLHGMPRVIRAVEEPKINIIQGYHLAAFIRQHVKVSLGGLGGDELFAGYDVHRYCNTLGRLNALVPPGLQRALLQPASRGLWQLQARRSARRHDLWRIGAQIACSIGDRAQFYARLRNAWDFDRGMYGWIYARPDVFIGLPPVAESFTPYFDSRRPFLDQVLLAEFQTKMVDDFLLNEDRVTSAHGLEGRVPFLDRALVELALAIPARHKMRGTETKALWKQSAAGDLPATTLRKKKHGFTFSSYHQWQKDLRDAVSRELTREWCGQTGLFNYAFIRELLDYPPHPNLRWHYFMAWMMLGTKQWMEIFGVEDEA